jgi:hypothetical protein
MASGVSRPEASIQYLLYNPLTKEVIIHYEHLQSLKQIKCRCMLSKEAKDEKKLSDPATLSISLSKAPEEIYFVTYESNDSEKTVELRESTNTKISSLIGDILNNTPHFPEQEE